MDQQQSQLPAEAERHLELLPRMAKVAIARGDVGGVVRAFCPNAQVFEALEAPAKKVMAHMADAIAALHNRDVAAIGNHESFVRVTPDGTIRQVLRPVRLSKKDGTLYGFKGTTKLTYEGFCRINAVVGAHVGLPHTVHVDGESRINPYVERMEGRDGRLGDIRRVVVGVVVVGPSPDTGNVVAVNYLLDYDPAKDLQHMLAKLSEDIPEDVFLIPEQFYEPQQGWHWVPAAAGVGYAHNLRSKDVRETYQKYINIVQNASKKAQTVARRNAMRSHPAFNVHSVELAGSDWAVRVPVIGWAVDGEAQAQWADLAKKMARGQAIDVEAIETKTVTDVYEPERDDELAEGVDQAPELDEATQELNLLMERIDDGIALLTRSDMESFHKRMREAAGDVEALTAIHQDLNAALDRLG